MGVCCRTVRIGMGLLSTIKRAIANSMHARPRPPAAAVGRRVESTVELAVDAGLQRASAHWGEQARKQLSQTIPSSWAECPVVIGEYINPLISGQAEVGWLEAVARKYFASPVERALSLGCGGGALERHGLQLGLARSFTAYDFSSDAVALAVSLAEESGLSGRIAYGVANLNTMEFEKCRFGAVLASQSIHHIHALERYLDQVRESLLPVGLFIFNEYIGPSQFQWTDPQLEHARRLLATIPEGLRQMIREPGIKRTIERPTIEQMNAYDPTEAVRSADIMLAVEDRFDVVSRKDFGGTLLHLVLDNIAGNLSGHEEGRQILRRLFAEEQRLIAAREIASDFTLVVARRRT